MGRWLMDEREGAPAAGFLKEAAALGCRLSAEQMEQYALYAELLRVWNDKMNLTALLDVEEVYVKHFLDSLTVAKTVVDMNAKVVFDLGSGAGFPGVALKIALPELQVTLVDALRKRVDFLEMIVVELGLKGVLCAHGRAEDLARNSAHRDGADVVTARAVAPLPVLVEWCLPFVRTGGIFVAMKGPAGLQELDAAKGAVRALRGEYVGHEMYELPEGAGARTLLRFKKAGPTPNRFPRRAGDAKRDPL